MQNWLESWYLDMNYQWVTVKTEGLTQQSCTCVCCESSSLQSFLQEPGPRDRSHACKVHSCSVAGKECLKTGLSSDLGKLRKMSEKKKKNEEIGSCSVEIRMGKICPQFLRKLQRELGWIADWTWVSSITLNKGQTLSWVIQIWVQPVNHVE